MSHKSPQSKVPRRLTHAVADVPNPDPMLPPAAAARYCHSNDKTLAYYRWKGVGPAYIRFGGRVYYRKSDLDAYIAANRVVPTEAA